MQSHFHVNGVVHIVGTHTLKVPIIFEKWHLEVNKAKQVVKLFCTSALGKVKKLYIETIL